MSKDGNFLKSITNQPFEYSYTQNAINVDQSNA